MTGFEPTASWSRTKRATNCATPRKEKPQQLGCCGVVGDERIELPRAESESAALPLCESPSGFVFGVCPQRSYIIACPTGFVNAFFEKTSIFSPKFSVFQNSSLLRQSFSVIRCRWISLTAGGTFISWAIPHNSKCRYGERGAAAAKPKAQIILDVLSSILATQMPCRSRRSGA